MTSTGQAGKASITATMLVTGLAFFVVRWSIQKGSLLLTGTWISILCAGIHILHLKKICVEATRQLETSVHQVQALLDLCKRKDARLQQEELEQLDLQGTIVDLSRKLIAMQTEMITKDSTIAQLSSVLQSRDAREKALTQRFRQARKNIVREWKARVDSLEHLNDEVTLKSRVLEDELVDCRGQLAALRGHGLSGIPDGGPIGFS
ncbi:hypothetical protein D9611_004366 [Ephemerocybe angulata]|uniref:Uncharacterized protein n=1 Tax=Ephemerocybe angulata TaxID=980116 RepID=A0A8H5BJS8_9AGAR|nr:hypothetical protein D9611_004366 [Tulosesus angulatus]